MTIMRMPTRCRRGAGGEARSESARSDELRPCKLQFKKKRMKETQLKRRDGDKARIGDNQGPR